MAHRARYPPPTQAEGRGLHHDGGPPHESRARVGASAAKGALMTISASNGVKRRQGRTPIIVAAHVAEAALVAANPSCCPRPPSSVVVGTLYPPNAEAPPQEGPHRTHGGRLGVCATTQRQGRQREIQRIQAYFAAETGGNRGGQGAGPGGACRRSKKGGRGALHRPAHAHARAGATRPLQALRPRWRTPHDRPRPGGRYQDSGKPAHAARRVPRRRGR
jgi:hypothetical protein